ncbi:hypothetical protein D4R52_02285 [bacterium]|nr:MAG: hypothetical protein D4R52_02285 [bacterium]
MVLCVLYLNIEKSKHLDAVIQLLREKKPDVACFAEAMAEDVKKIASQFGYELAFAPLVVVEEGENKDQSGSAILSRYPMRETKKYRYDDNTSEELPVYTESKTAPQNGKRPADRFLYHNALLAASLQYEKDRVVTIATTHFPVVDHGGLGSSDHELNEVKDVRDVEHASIYLDRLISIIRSLRAPLVFTADLNNARGEYVYNEIAHELIDIVPRSVSSTIDPQLHRKPYLKMLVDTIMTSAEVSVKNFEIIEGVSDHKALLASLLI